VFCLCGVGSVAAWVGLRLNHASHAGKVNTTASASCGRELLYAGPPDSPGDAQSTAAHNGTTLAVEQYNAKHAKCPVTLRTALYSLTGNDGTAKIQVAAAGRDRVVGVVGTGFGLFEPMYSAMLARERLTAIVTGYAHTGGVVADGHPTVFSTSPSIDLAGRATAGYLRNTVKADKVFVIEEDNSYGQTMAAAVGPALGGALAGQVKMPMYVAGAPPAGLADRVKASGATAVYFAGGISPGLGKLLKGLRDAGVTASFVGSSTLFLPTFLSDAGDAGEGALVICGCTPVGAVGGDFLAAYRQRFGIAATPEGGPAYDAANIYLAAIEAGRSRADMAAFVAGYTGTGVAGGYQFDDKGAITPGRASIYAIKAHAGAWPDTGDRIPLS